MDCIFCKIANGKFNTEFILQEDDWVAFRDIDPQAPSHILIIPHRHIASLHEANDPQLLGRLLDGARRVAQKLNLSDYRVVINTGEKAGQSVLHLHLHLLAGRPLAWPPG